MIDSAQLVNAHMNILFQRQLWKYVCTTQGKWWREKWFLVFTKTAFIDRKIILSNGYTHLINGARCSAYSLQTMTRVP
jgi:hypothetical protein